MEKFAFSFHDLQGQDSWSCYVYPEVLGPWFEKGRFEKWFTNKLTNPFPGLVPAVGTTTCKTRGCSECCPKCNTLSHSEAGLIILRFVNMC